MTVASFTRRPVRAIVIRHQYGLMPNGTPYNFLVAECVAGRAPDGKPIGARDYGSAMRQAQDMARRTGLPIIVDDGEDDGTSPPFAA